MKSLNNRKLRGSLLLMITAMIWGLAFVAQSVAADLIGPMTFNGIRFLLASLEVFLLEPFLSRFLKIEAAESSSGWMKTAVLAGLVLITASWLQQAGIRYTTAGKAGFITSFYVVLVPLAQLLFLHHKSAFNIWIAVGIACIGLYLLSSPEKGAVQFGDFLELLCAVCFTVHILVIASAAGNPNPIRFCAVQYLTAGVVGIIFGMLFELFSTVSLLKAAPSILYAGFLSAGLGYTLQAIGQRDADPAVASVILSLESVFSALFGFWLLGETMNGAELLGCVLMFAAVLLSQIDMKKE
ncbi:MAG: DMT family transporter [Solobacterium sp.]|nr:DMT family transporter [Solobacterium sp.]